MSIPRKCSFTKPDGTACRAAATASGYCFFHSGDTAEAGRKGGRRKRKRLPVDAEAVPLATVGDVTAALAATFNDVRGGRLDPKTGNCLGLLAGQLLKALQESELAAEIEDLAKEVREIKRGNGNPQKEGEDASDGIASNPAGGDASVVPFAGRSVSPSC